MAFDIDPEMRYCPKCNDEYEPEMTACGVCGTALLLGAELHGRRHATRQQVASRKGALTPDDEIITIFKASLNDARRVERLLQRENIGTLLWGDKPSCGKGCCGGGDLELRVRREDAGAAMLLIEEDFKRQTASHGEHHAVADYVVDPENSENVCPACGATFALDSRSGRSLTCPDCGLCFG